MDLKLSSIGSSFPGTTFKCSLEGTGWGHRELERGPKALCSRLQVRVWNVHLLDLSVFAYLMHQQYLPEGVLPTLLVTRLTPSRT